MLFRWLPEKPCGLEGEKSYRVGLEAEVTHKGRSAVAGRGGHNLSHAHTMQLYVNMPTIHICSRGVAAGARKKKPLRVTCYVMM